MKHLDTQLALLRGQSRNPLAAVRRNGMPGTRVRPRSPTLLSDGIACALLAAMAEGRLAPGARIPSEPQMAEAAGVSRVTVRAALACLKGDDLLVSRRGESTRVASADTAGGSRIESLVEGYRATMQEMGEVIEFLVSHAILQLGAREDETFMFAFTPEGIGSMNDPAIGEIDFLMAIATRSGSVLCQHMLQALRMSMQRFYAHAFVVARRLGTIGQIEATSRQTVEAIAGRRTSLALKAFARHMQLLREAAANHSPAAFQDVSEALDLLKDISKSWTADAVLRSLQSLLSSYRREIGGHLPSERMLADQLGVSRSSIRVAQARLRQQGYIEAAERSGTRVAAAYDGPKDLHAQTWSIYRTCSDMCEIRSLIEPWAVHRAASMAQPEDIEALKRVLRETSRSCRSERLKGADDMRFHRAVAVASGSAVHLYLAEINDDILHDYFDFSLSGLHTDHGTDGEVQHHHAGIVRSIEQGDPAEAAGWQSEHSRIFQLAYRHEQTGLPSILAQE